MDFFCMYPSDHKYEKSPDYQLKARRLTDADADADVDVEERLSKKQQIADADAR
jgi:hypothetical protein